MVAPADKPERGPKGGKDPEVLAERRARRAELAESELRARLADAEQRVAQLEHGAHEAVRLRERLASRAERDGRMAALVADAATTLRAAREALDREIAARGVLEAALGAERAAREAAEQAVVAERLARDAATSALTAERARVPAPPVFGPPAPAPAAPDPVPAEEAAPPAPVAIAVPGPAPAEEAPAPVLDNEQLIAGLALAADRLRAQTPVVEEPAPEPAPAPRPEPEVTPAPAAAAASQPEPAPDAASPEEPWAPRPGGLVERLGRAFRRRS